MNTIDKLTEYFKQFPGVGPRQARRFVYYLLRKNSSFTKEISALLPKLKEEIFICSSCNRFVEKENSRGEKCKICADKNRDMKKLLIVAQDIDIDAIEKSDDYNGLYFVLGGLIPILEKSPERLVKISALKERISNQNLQIEEVIIALSVSPEGDNTVEVLKKELKNLPNSANFKITILGRGLSTGTEIEYTDPETIKNALKNRG